MFPYPISFLNTAAGLADIDNAFSMEFDGVDDVVTTGHIESGDFTLSAWINCDGTYTADHCSSGATHAWYCINGEDCGDYIEEICSDNFESKKDFNDYIDEMEDNDWDCKSDFWN